MKPGHHYQALTDNSRALLRNLIGALLILAISGTIVVTILAPELGGLFKMAMESSGLFGWLPIFGCTLIIGFLIIFPILLIVQGYSYYRDAHNLERLGTLTKGSIAQKWVEASDGKPICHILYVYSLGIRAIQIVDKEVFHALQLDQIIDVVHLQHAPHISRLELSL